MTVRRLETVHRLRYFRFCNVLHIWTIRAIPTYRVYRMQSSLDHATICHPQNSINFYIYGALMLFTVGSSQE